MIALEPVLVICRRHEYNRDWRERRQLKSRLGPLKAKAQKLSSMASSFLRQSAAHESKIANGEKNFNDD